MLNHEWVNNAARFLLAACTASGLAVSSVWAETDLGAWTTLGLRSSEPGNPSYNLDVQLRWNNDVKNLERTLLRPFIAGTVGDYGWAVGYDAHFVRPASTSVEHRAWQQIGRTYQMGRTSALLKLRLEQRRIESIPSIGLRPRLGLELKGPRKGAQHQWIVRNEYFYRANSMHNGVRRGFDQNRFFIGSTLPENWLPATTVGLQWQHVNRPDDDLDSFQLVLTKNLDVQ